MLLGLQMTTGLQERKANEEGKSYPRVKAGEECRSHLQSQLSKKKYLRLTARKCRAQVEGIKNELLARSGDTKYWFLKEPKKIREPTEMLSPEFSM